jgi:hypothetical protein
MYNADDHDLVTSRCTVVKLRLLVQWYIFSMSKSTLLYLFISLQHNKFMEHI